MDAIARGTEDGLKLWLGIVAMLLVIVALVALCSTSCSRLVPHCAARRSASSASSAGSSRRSSGCTGFRGLKPRPRARCIGQKTVLNEFVAYLKLAALPAGALDPRAQLIMVYAMCGFANFGSVGIMIAGVSSLVPERRDEIVPLAMRALLSGTMASGLTGCIIGLLPVS